MFSRISANSEMDSLQAPEEFIHIDPKAGQPLSMGMVQFLSENKIPFHPSLLPPPASQWPDLVFYHLQCRKCMAYTGAARSY